MPEHVRVEFEVKPSRANIDVTLTKFVYDSKQGWSGAGALGFTVQQNTFLFGLASDGDTLNERFAGISARYENKHLGTDRLEPALSIRELSRAVEPEHPERPGGAIPT